MTSTTLQINKREVITIPKLIRDSYEIKSGDTFTLFDLGGVFVLNPINGLKMGGIWRQCLRRYKKNETDLETKLKVFLDTSALFAAIHINPFRFPATSLFAAVSISGLIALLIR